MYGRLGVYYHFVGSVLLRVLIPSLMKLFYLIKNKNKNIAKGILSLTTKNFLYVDANESLCGTSRAQLDCGAICLDLISCLSS